MKTKMESIKVWTSNEDIKSTQEWLEPLLIKRQMSGRNPGIDLDVLTLTGRGLGRMRLGINFAKVFPKWLDLKVMPDTAGGEKATGYLGLESDATLLDIIDAMPRFATFKMTASDGREHFNVTLVGIKSYEEDKHSLQEVEIRVCDLNYKG